MADEIVSRVPKQLQGHELTHENAPERARRRWEIAREKAAEGMTEAVEEIIGKLHRGEPAGAGQIHTNAWKQVMKRATEEYFKSKSLRGMAEMATFIGKNTGMIHEPVRGEANVGGLPLYGLEEARTVMQVFNFYNKEYEKEREELNVIDLEVNELID